MNKTQKSWCLGNSIEIPSEMQNGHPFDNRMVGAYYGSSLEYNTTATPQYLNAGDLVAPVHDDVKNVFKPKRPFGTFGCILADDAQNEYQFNCGRAVVEICSVEEVSAVADALSSETRIIPLLEKLSYTTKTGSTLSYQDALKLQSSYRAHNDQIQKEIDQLIEASGYKTQVLNGRKRSEKYPEHLLTEIAHLAKQKKAITGFNIKIQVFGKHTIAKGGNFATGSLNQDQLDHLRKKLGYTEKPTYSQGVVRVGTVMVPIQSMSHLNMVKKILSNINLVDIQKWPDRVNKTRLNLTRG